MKTNLKIDNVVIKLAVNRVYPRMHEVKLSLIENDIVMINPTTIQVEATKPYEAITDVLDDIIFMNRKHNTLEDKLFFEKLDVHSKFLGAYVERKKHIASNKVSDLEGFYTILDMFDSGVTFNDENRYQFQRLFDEILKEEIEDLDYEQIYQQFYKWARRFFNSEQFHNEELSEVDAMTDFLKEIKPIIKFD